MEPGRSGWPQEVKILKDLRTRTKGRETLAIGMDLVGVANELLALAAFSKVRSSICGRQAKAAFWAACRRFLGLEPLFILGAEIEARRTDVKFYKSATTSSPPQEKLFIRPPFYQYNRRLLRQKAGGACLYMPNDGYWLASFEVIPPPQRLALSRSKN